MQVSLAPPLLAGYDNASDSGVCGRNVCSDAAGGWNIEAGLSGGSPAVREVVDEEVVFAGY